MLDAHAEVGGATQVEQPRGHAVEPHDLPLGVEDDHAVRQRGGGTLQLSHELHEALLVEALAAVQAHDLRNDFAPYSADIRRVGVAAMPQPPFQAEQVGQHPGEGDGERAGEPAPAVAEQRAHSAADHYGGEQAPRREPPCLCRGFHWSWRLFYKESVVRALYGPRRETIA